MKYLIIYLLFVSCNSKQKKEPVQITDVSSNNVIPRDTLITYNIEGVSTQGAEAKVNYKNGKITKGAINIYGETGRASIMYSFEADKIVVLEDHYSYDTTFENVKSDKDVKKDTELHYVIDLKGNVIGKPIQDRIDIYPEFRKVVPFEIK